MEHFSKEDGEKLILECFRVLKPGGVLRIAIPDLEVIAKNYLHYINEGMNNQDDEIIRANYEWMLLEMYDQTVRNQSGGNMGKYLKQNEIINEDFVLQRIGAEGQVLRDEFLKPSIAVASNNLLISYSKQLKSILKGIIKKVFKPYISYEIGAFRKGGEIHQWMYDRYSLTNLLRAKGGSDIIIRDAFSSYIKEWATYEIDGKYPITRKPDSLFMEALK